VRDYFIYYLTFVFLFYVKNIITPIFLTISLELVWVIKRWSILLEMDLPVFMDGIFAGINVSHVW